MNALTALMGSFGSKLDGVNDDLTSLRDSQGAMEDYLAGDGYADDPHADGNEVDKPPEHLVSEEEGEVDHNIDEDKQTDQGALQLLSVFRQDCGLSDHKQPPVDAGWAAIVNAFATGGVTDKVLSDRKAAILDIENTNMLVAPRLNECVWNVIQKETRSRDSSLQNVQKAVMKGLIPIVKLADKFLQLKTNKNGETPDPNEVFNEIANGVTLILAGHHNLNMMRRELVKPDLNKDFKSICSQNCPITTELFGDDLPKRLKDIGDANKAGNKVQANRSTAKWSNAGRGSRNFGTRGVRHQYGGRGRGGSFHPYTRPFNNYQNYQNKNKGYFLDQSSSPYKKQERGRGKKH